MACEVLVDAPKSPNTKPPMATEATSVTAMMRTVAIIGETALLWRRGLDEGKAIAKTMLSHLT